jgi:hypothetical protein
MFTSYIYMDYNQQALVSKIWKNVLTFWCQWAAERPVGAVEYS